MTKLLVWISIVDEKTGERSADLLLGEPALMVRDGLTIGRSDTCDLVLDSADVAGNHAEIETNWRARSVRAHAPGVSVEGVDVPPDETKPIEGALRIAHFTLRFEETEIDDGRPRLATSAEKDPPVVRRGARAVCADRTEAPSLGDESDRLVAWFQRVKASRWAWPDDQTAALGSEVMDWVNERALAFNRALTHSRGEPPDVRIVRSIPAFQREFIGAWRILGHPYTAPATIHALACLHALDRLTARIARAALNSLGHQGAVLLERSIADAGSPKTRPYNRWNKTIVPALGDERRACAPLAIAQRVAESLVVYGDRMESLSPWLPLWELIEKGFIPALMPFGGLLLYLPVLRRIEVVVDPFAEGERPPNTTLANTNLASFQSCEPLLLCPTRAWRTNMLTPSHPTAAAPPRIARDAAVSSLVLRASEDGGEQLRIGTHFRFPMQKMDFRMGRSSGDEIEIASPHLTDRHVRFAFREDHYWPIPSSAATNVFVNDSRLPRSKVSRPLLPGDMLRIGALEFEFTDRKSDMDPLERELLEAIDRDPRDGARRAVYADWLEEHGRVDEASVARHEAIAAEKTQKAAVVARAS